ncbi:hypothetical protein [Pedobacter sp. D749]|uniref:hypothetical protein n=1 Tax=Pedobacter sp. D749 TaxID=2856523 RepID=UPI001C57273E|nr:hypothetical protein [Pedobacter sp. D749]QXU41153.1 hypothetical protein KYH19_19455 [Pedobacter sp. D749]
MAGRKPIKLARSISKLSLNSFFAYRKLSNYILGGGKLVAVRIPNEPIGLKFISDDETESVIYEQAIFHRKNIGDALTLIR